MILYQKRVELVTLDSTTFKKTLEKLTSEELIDNFAPSQAVADQWSILSQLEIITKIFELGEDVLAQV